MRNLILCILLCFCVPGLAAENDPPAQDVEQEASNSAPEQGNAAGDSTQGGADDGGDLIAAEISDTNETEEESSARFIPTEEISQDLGVSFPVDI